MSPTPSDSGAGFGGVDIGAGAGSAGFVGSLSVSSTSLGAPAAGASSLVGAAGFRFASSSTSSISSGALSSSGSSSSSARRRSISSMWGSPVGSISFSSFSGGGVLFFPFVGSGMSSRFSRPSSRADFASSRIPSRAEIISFDSSFCLTTVGCSLPGSS